MSDSCVTEVVAADQTLFLAFTEWNAVRKLTRAGDWTSSQDICLLHQFLFLIFLFLKSHTSSCWHFSQLLTAATDVKLSWDSQVRAKRGELSSPLRPEPNENQLSPTRTKKSNRFRFDKRPKKSVNESAWQFQYKREQESELPPTIILFWPPPLKPREQCPIYGSEWLHCPKPHHALG